MANTIPTNDWLEHIDAEYLSTFVKDGGASIKFVVTADDSRPGWYEAVEGRSGELDYFFVRLDAARLRVHMPQDIFFGLAQQIEWRSLARRLILRLAADSGYHVDDVESSDAANIFDAIAGANGLESKFVLTEIKPGIQARIFNNPTMVKDFRVAMTHLCLSENTHRAGEYAGQPLLDWLTGENTRVSGVRPFSIYTSINRTTARYFIESALHWIRCAGRSGTVMLVDNRRVTLARNPKDGFRYYTRAMAMDHYELLREFVDGVDRLAGTLMLVAANEDFLAEGHGSRGFAIYDALKTRVMNDVRDRNLVNPVASLVRLS